MHNFANPFEDPDGLVFLDQSLDGYTGSTELFRCCLLRTLLSYSGQTTDQGGTRLTLDLADAPPDVSQDGRTWTFRLKTGIHYAPPLERQTVTARDIVRAILRYGACLACPPGFAGSTASPFDVVEGFTAYAKGKAASISGLETPDDLTLVVRLDQPSGSLGYLFSEPYAAPLPAAPSDPQARFGIAQGMDQGFGPFTAALGPYMIEGAGSIDYGRAPADRVLPSGYVRDTSITLVRNPSWDRATDRYRAASVDRIEITKVEDPATALADVVSSTADVAFDFETPTDLTRSFLADPLRAGRVMSAAADQLQYLTLNLAQPPLDDLHVRRAISLAIDRAALADARRKIQGQEGDVFRHAFLDSLEDNLLLNYDPYRTEGDRGDSVAAKAEMALSTYDANGDGTCDGRTCHVVALVRATDVHRALAAEIAADLAPLGITLDVTLTKDFFTDLAPGKPLGMAVDLAYAKDYPAADSFVTQAFRRTSEAVYWSPMGVGMTAEDLRAAGSPVASVPSLADRMDECLALVGDAELRCWAALDQYVMEEVVPFVPYFSMRRTRIVSDRVVHASMDQFSTIPALDQFAVRP
jgi:peptide/nickel transport system substrate-binding protein